MKPNRIATRAQVLLMLLFLANGCSKVENVSPEAVMDMLRRVGHLTEPSEKATPVTVIVDMRANMLGYARATNHNILLNVNRYVGEAVANQSPTWLAFGRPETVGSGGPPPTYRSCWPINVSIRDEPRSYGSFRQAASWESLCADISTNRNHTHIIITDLMANDSTAPTPNARLSTEGFKRGMTKLSDLGVRAGLILLRGGYNAPYNSLEKYDALLKMHPGVTNLDRRDYQLPSFDTTNRPLAILIILSKNDELKNYDPLAQRLAERIGKIVTVPESPWANAGKIVLGSEPNSKQAQDIWVDQAIAKDQHGQVPINTFSRALVEQVELSFTVSKSPNSLPNSIPDRVKANNIAGEIVMGQLSDMAGTFELSNLRTNELQVTTGTGDSKLTALQTKISISPGLRYVVVCRIVEGVRNVARPVIEPLSTDNDSRADQSDKLYQLWDRVIEMEGILSTHYEHVSIINN